MTVSLMAPLTSQIFAKFVMAEDQHGLDCSTIADVLGSIGKGNHPTNTTLSDSLEAMMHSSHSEAPGVAQALSRFVGVAKVQEQPSVPTPPAHPVAIKAEQVVKRHLPDGVAVVEVAPAPQPVTKDRVLNALRDGNAFKVLKFIARAKAREPHAVKVFKTLTLDDFYCLHRTRGTTQLLEMQMAMFDEIASLGNANFSTHMRNSLYGRYELRVVHQVNQLASQGRLEELKGLAGHKFYALAILFITALTPGEHQTLATTKMKELANDRLNNSPFARQVLHYLD